MLNANNSSMNGDQYMLKWKRHLRNLRIIQEYFQPQIGRKIRILSMSSTGPEKNNSFIKRKSVNWVCVLHTLSQTPKGRLTDFNMKM